MRAEQVIATHGNTDFDGFASMLAARRLYPGAVACVAGSLNRNVREFYRLHADALEDVVEVARLELEAIRRLVVVETVNASRLGELEPVARDASVEKVVFDHHESLPDWAPRENVVLSDDGALTTTLVGILAERELAVTPLEATAFALGIHEDTGSLTYPSATQRDAEALGWCLRHGASQELVARFLHLPLTEAERELLNALLDAAETVEVQGNELMLAAVVWPRYVDGISNLAHKLVDLTDARALALLVEMDDRVFAVVRSRTGDLDAGALAATLGGGGHAEAASAIFRGSLGEARARLVGEAPRALQRTLTAVDVMSTPPRCVGPDDSVADAMIACQRYRQSGIFVAEDGRVVGVVAREDLDKAIGHSLAHAPVKAVMSGRVTTTDERTPVGELQRLVLEAPGGRAAVLRDGRIVGVVARTDLLRVVGVTPGEPAEPAPSLLEHLERLEHLAPVFDAIRLVSGDLDGVYLVGGTVRDILSGAESFDVDIAVEGDAIALARRLADALDGRVRPHEKFGTAAVLYGDDGRVDVVTTRTEFYDAPAALPTVEHATIREDLFRRDFTINAMAVSLKGEDFGRLVDPFGGFRDLRDGVIRVLHNLSFIDDPTRIFRAVRYESRGYRMDEHTEALARACIEMGLVGDLSSARLRDELIALIEYADTKRAFVRLGDLGADRAIHPHLAGDADAARLLDRMEKVAHRFDLWDEVELWRLGMIALARNLSADEAYDWLDRLKVRRRDTERIAGAITVGPKLVERLGGDPPPADVVRAADPYAPDAPLYALALADVPALEAYFERLRNVRLEITGSDLARLGLSESPRVGEVLDELRRRKLNGQLDGRESELAAARELIETA